MFIEAAKITNVAKNLLKICKREIMEIETCAECYYNSIVRIDTWFIEVCVSKKTTIHIHLILQCFDKSSYFFNFFF